MQFRINNYSYGELGNTFKRYFSSSECHIHVFRENNPEMHQSFLFRDYLRNNLAARQKYKRLKAELAAEYPKIIEGNIPLKK